MEKQTIILLHGALGSQKELENLKQALASEFEVFSLDFEGHGANAGAGNYTMEDFSGNLQDFMADKGIERTNIFGYSMGGYVALTFAKAHPEKVHKIVTLGTKFAWTPESADQEVQRLDPAKITEKVPAFAGSLAEIHGEENWKNVVSKTAEMMTSLGNGKAFKPSELSEIETNTLLLLAEFDNMVTVSETEHVQHYLPNAVSRILHDAKHPMDSVDVKALAEIITDFIL